MLKAQVGDYPIQVSYTPRGVILSGTAPNAEVVATAMRVTEPDLGAGALVFNKIQMAGSLQVNLSAHVAEVSCSAMTELVIHPSALGRIGTFSVGFLPEDFDPELFPEITGAFGASQEVPH
ncbi:hypothetical protein ACD578_30660 (plasmid) [Microvirga sp. RSM25]|uniref:hypothetical protein n=1 Tax=Microvirga sp. RSM25 TaxID=3273802 RepID=UPI0038515319